MITISILWFAAPLSSLVAAEISSSEEQAAATFEQHAAELRQLGLFQGSDHGFELEREPTRTEALVMLIRLLGKEEVALEAGRSAEAPAHPFTDVPSWAQAYVDYAWKHQLTLGVSPTSFGANQPVSSAQYLTFVLRALGYDDSKGDFEWSRASEKAVEIGMATARDYRRPEGHFLRAHLVDISYGSLSAPLKGREQTLLRKLIDEGQVSQEAAQRAGLPVAAGQGEYSPPRTSEPAGEPEHRTRTVPVTVERGAAIVNGIEHGMVSVDRDTLLREFPQFASITQTSFTVRSVERTAEERERLALLGLLMSGMMPDNPVNDYLVGPPVNLERPTALAGGQDYGKMDVFRAYGFSDAHNRLFAYTTLADLDINKQTWTIHYYSDERTLEEKTADIIDEARQLMKGAVYLTHEYANPDEAARSIPVKLDYKKSESRTIMPDGSVHTEHIANAVLPRSALPESVRPFTHKSGIGIWWSTSRPHSPDEFAETPLMSRLSYLLYRDGQVVSTGLHYMPWNFDELSFLTRESAESPGVIFSFLEDDSGHLLAYTSFYYPSPVK